MEITKEIFELTLESLQAQIDFDKQNSDLIGDVFKGDVGCYDNSLLIKAIVGLLRLRFPVDEEGFCELDHYIFYLDFGRYEGGMTIGEFWEELISNEK